MDLKSIGSYEIIRELGRGGMGVIYKAHEQSLNRVVALKVLAPHLDKDATFVKRFRREARAMAQLNHNNIVTIHAVGEHDGVNYIAMEYIRGYSVAQLIAQKGQLDVRQALGIARQTARAFKAARERQIVHRDIKPENIMIDEANCVKVLDFGLAKIMQGATTYTTEGHQMGTPAYMSPEQVRGESIDFRSDIYSLGVTLFPYAGGIYAL